MNHVYQTIVDKIEMYAVKYGYEPNDVNWDNFLFSDDLKIVNIIESVCKMVYLLYPALIHTLVGAGRHRHLKSQPISRKW